MPSLPHLFYVLLCLFGFIDTFRDFGKPALEVSNQTLETLRWFGITAELINPNETLDIYGGTFHQKVVSVRNILFDIIDAPTIRDVERFIPPNNESIDNINISIKYSWKLEWVREISGNKDLVDKAISKTKRLYAIWLLVSDIRTGNYTWYYQRSKLREIKDLIGNQNYHQGMLPNPVPLEFFQETD